MKHRILAVEKPERAGGIKELIAQTYPESSLETISPSELVLSLSMKPELIIMDIQASQIEEVELVCKLKATVSDGKILVLTAEPDFDHLRAVLLSGALGYCLRDNDISILNLALHSVAVGALWVDPAFGDKVYTPEGLAELQSARNILRNEHFLPVLSDRELEVLELLVQGLSNKEMAECLGVGVETIKTHMRHVMEKLTVTDRTQAAIKALRLGLVE